MKSRNNQEIKIKEFAIHRTKYYLLKIGMFILLLLLSEFLHAQPSVQLRLTQTEFQNNPPKVCYEIQLKNTSSSDINLAGQNFRLFYNSSEISLVQIESYSLLPSITYTDLVIVQSFEDVDGSGVGGPFSYDNTLGFLNFYIDLNDILNGGVIISADGGELSLARLCFDILVDADEVCIDLEFAQFPLTFPYASVECIISSWVSNFEQQVVIVDSIQSINEMNEDSCIILKENTYALCNDGIDNDGDGLIDCDDDECVTPEINTVLVVQPIACDTPQIGSITITTNTPNNLYSIDGGQTYSSDSVFLDLVTGNYNVLVQNSTSGCTAEYGEVFIVEQGCEIGFCNDGIDNDGDGLIDCDDDECMTPEINTVLVVQPIVCDTPQIGSITITTNTPNNLYSIDGGQTYSSDSVFLDLVTGNYNVLVQNSTSGCTVEYGEVFIVEQGCEIGFCNDGIDNDGDGLIDCDDDECVTPEINTVLVVQPIACDTPQIGSITITTNTPKNLYSIDGGQTYSSDSVFLDLVTGNYNVLVQNSTSGCTVEYGEVFIVEQRCEIGFCNDGIDNDGDGLIDCDDDECHNAPNCKLDIIFSNVIFRSSADDYLSIFIPNFRNVKAFNIKVYDRWGNLMLSTDFDSVDSHLKVNFDDLDKWASGVFMIKASITRWLDESESIVYSTLTVL